MQICLKLLEFFWEPVLSWRWVGPSKLEQLKGSENNVKKMPQTILKQVHQKNPTMFLGLQS